MADASRSKRDTFVVWRFESSHPYQRRTMKEEVKPVEYVGPKRAISTTWEHQTEAKYAACDCGNELLQIQRSIELFDEDHYDVHYYLAMYSYGTNVDKRNTWKDRLRQIWLIIKGDGIYSDQMILDYDTAKKWRDDLTELLNESEIGKKVKGMKKEIAARKKAASKPKKKNK